MTATSLLMEIHRVRLDDLSEVELYELADALTDLDERVHDRLADFDEVAR